MKELYRSLQSTILLIVVMITLRDYVPDFGCFVGDNASSLSQDIIHTETHTSIYKILCFIVLISNI